MPKPPDGFLSRLNYIADFFFDPCDAPLTLYVETMLPAALEAAILWYAPVPDEILTSWARPSQALGRYRSSRKGTRGRKSGRRTKRGLFYKMVNFDTNEFIGKKLPGAEFLGRWSMNWGSSFVWKIFGLTQLVGLAWLIWEVVTGFFAKWFSLLYETEYCRETSAAIVSARDGGYQISNIVEHNGFLARTIEKQRGPITFGPGGGTTSAKGLVVSASCEIEGDFQMGSWIQLSLWDGTPGSSTLMARERVFLFGQNLRQISAGATYPEGGQYQLSWETNVLILSIQNIEFYAQANVNS